MKNVYCEVCGRMLYRVNDDGLILYYTAIVRKIDRLNARIAELEKDNDEFRQLIHDWIIILTPDDGYVPDSECNDVATPIDVALRKRIAELEAKNNRLVELAEGLADMVDWSGCDCDKPFILTEWEEFIAEVQE